MNKKERQEIGEQKWLKRLKNIFYTKTRKYFKKGDIRMKANAKYANNPEDLKESSIGLKVKEQGSLTNKNPYEYAKHKQALKRTRVQAKKEIYNELENIEELEEEY